MLLARLNKFLPILILSLLYCLSEFFSTGRALEPERTVIWFFDIGQGDAIFINAPDKQVLIDGGPSDLVLERLASVLPFWDQSIDLVVNTHPHADHFTGLISVLDQYEIGEVWVSGAQHDSAGYIEFEQAAPDEYQPTFGQKIDLGRGAFLQVIHSPLLGDGYLSDPNDASLVLEFVQGETTVLLTGDSGLAQEAEFVSAIDHIDVLKVGHHGSKTSTGGELLSTIAPQVAVISVGSDNDYGHPYPLIVDRLERAEVIVLQTDLVGTIRLTTDGGEPELLTER